MIKKSILTLSLCVCLSVSAGAISFSDKPYINPIQLQNDELFDKRYLQSCGQGFDSDCYDSVRKKWQAEGRSRGSNEYCDVHLVPQSSEELKRIAKDLLKIKAGSGIPNREPGEVTQDEIDHEIWCIDRILADRNESR